MTISSSAIRPITGRFVLIAVVCFFAVVIGVNTVMMRFAIATLPGTDVDSAYSASLAIRRKSRPRISRTGAIGRSLRISSARPTGRPG